MPHSDPPFPSLASPTSPIYTVHSAPGKGLGLFATRSIPRGTHILRDTPVLKLHIDQSSVTISAEDDAAILGDLTDALAGLASEQQAEFHSLTATGGNSRHELVRKYQTNNHLYTFEDGTKGACINLEIAHINHACVSNCDWVYRRQSDTWDVISTQPIAEGEEITVSYLPYLRFYTRVQRQAVTAKIWGFRCQCRLCCAKEEVVKVSDVRRVLMLGLWQILEGHEGGDVTLDMSDVAFAASGGESLCSVPAGVRSTWSEADLTFAWWLFAKLQEAEGWYNQAIGDAYFHALESLKNRMIRVGMQGRKLKDVDSWLRNVRSWWRVGMAMSMVVNREEGACEWMPEGEVPWRETEKLYVVSVYNNDGQAVERGYSKDEFHEIEKLHEPGKIWCELYMERFGHLYGRRGAEGQGMGKTEQQRMQRAWNEATVEIERFKMSE